MKKFISIFALICSFGFAQGQDFDGYYSLGFDINQPLSNTEWVNNPGFGFKFGYQRFLNERFSLGADFNWGTYKKYEPTETTQLPSGAITTDYFKYVYAYGLVVSTHYHFPLANKHFLPYVGLGLGAANNKYTLFYNTYSDQKKVYGFLARPEAGLLIRFSERRSIGALVSLHYDISTARSKEQGYSNFSNLGISIRVMAIDW
jgi:opacity protein-like surface antigen